MTTRFADLVERLRGRVIAALHSGHVHPGDRLPSVRALAEELGEDPRAILRAYRLLEENGLVEIRTRSGVYLAPQEQVAPRIGWETSRWVVEEVLAEAWRRRIRLPELPEFLRRCIATTAVRCACADSVEDHRVAFCHEVREDFGMEPVEVPLREAHPANLRGALRGVDLVLTTGFHAAELRPLAAELGKPLVVMTMNPYGREEIERLKGRGTLTFVVLDPAFQERARLVFGDDVRVVPAGDRAAVDRLAGHDPVVLTRAAALRLGGRGPSTALSPQTPAFSAETARELAHWLVHFNLQALRSADGAGEA